MLICLDKVVLLFDKWFWRGGRMSLDRTRPNLTTLAYAGSRMECRPCRSKLSNVQVCIKAKDGDGPGKFQAKTKQRQAVPG